MVVYTKTAMNRIKELREAAGLTQEELGERCGTSGTQIWRLETGERKLTAEWMVRIGQALGVPPAELISNAIMAELVDEVEPAVMEGWQAVSGAMASQGLMVYRVLGESLVQLGIKPGDLVTVRESQAAIDAVQSLDIVLVQIEDAKVLRQFVAPNLLITNRPGANIVITTEDRSFKPQIVGVAIPSPPHNGGGHPPKSEGSQPRHQ